MTAFPCTFTCEPLLFVLRRMSPPTNQFTGATIAANAVDAARALATSLSRNVILVDGNELLVVLDDPVEAVAAARAHGLVPRRCVASALALELLREPGELAQDMWLWLCAQLNIDPRLAYSDGVVQLEPGRADAAFPAMLPPGIDEIPAGKGVWLWVLDRDRPAGQERGRMVCVDRDTLIGRARPDSDVGLAIDDPMLSKVHAEIVRHLKTWALVERGSLSGTYLEGVRFTRGCLVPGMVFHLGQSRIVVLSVR